jgi:drug/metabolite transporter (DMT)-like permease
LIQIIPRILEFSKGLESQLPFGFFFAAKGDGCYIFFKYKLKFYYKTDLIFLPIWLYSKLVMPEFTLKQEARNVLWPILLVFVMFILATVFPATKHLSREISPATIAFFRYFWGTVPLIPLFIVENRRKRRSVLRRDALAMAGLGVLGIALFSICYNFGLKLSTAYNGSLLINSQPIFTTLLAPLIIKEDFSVLRTVGALAGVVGVYLIVAGGLQLGSVLTHEYFWGNLILLGGALSISIYSILLKRYVIKYGGLVPTFLSMLSGTVVLLAAAVLITGRHVFHGITIGSWPLLIYIGVVGTALVYPLFNLALKATGVVRAVGFKLLIPVFGIALSIMLLGERPGLFTCFGAVIVIASVYLIQRIPVSVNK